MRVVLSQEESLRFTAAAVEEAGRRVVHEPVEGVLALGGLVHVREDPLLEHLAVHADGSSDESESSSDEEA